MYRPSIHARIRVILLVVLTGVPGLVFAQTDARYLAAKLAYETNLAEKADQPFELAFSQLNIQFEGALQRMEENFTAAGNLDGVITIRAERELFKNAGVPLEDNLATSELVKPLRETYRAQRKKLEETRNLAAFPVIDQYRAQLVTLLRTLTKEQLVEDALVVRTGLERLPKSVREMTEEGRTSLVFEQASIEHPFVNRLGMKFVPVEIEGEEGRSRKILVSVWETRVRDYSAFAEATKAEDGKWRNQTQENVTQTEEHPALTILAPQAVAFCQWLSGLENLNYRLPTTEEWGWAAEIRQAGQTKEQLEEARKRQPWEKGQASREVANFGRSKVDDHTFTAPVGSYPPNGHGIFDIYGNAWEWVLMPDESILRRGGSWGNDNWFYNGREEKYPGIAGPAMTQGFRVVIVPSS